MGNDNTTSVMNKLARTWDLKENLPIECVKAPCNPFYIRWLNRFGGIDQFMLYGDQDIGRKQLEQEVFEKHVADTLTASGTSYAISKEFEHTIVAGRKELSDNEWQELSLVAASPFIQYFDPDESDPNDPEGGAGRWFDILPVKSDNVMSSRDNGHRIEITFRFPTPRLMY